MAEFEKTFNCSDGICIVVPCYNESENIPKLIEKIYHYKERGELAGFDFVFVNDGSKDDSYKMITENEKKYSWVKSVNHEKNKGFAEALNSGRNYCLNKNYLYIGQIDCDMTHPLSLLPDMAEYLNEYDMVVASRYVKGGGMKNVPLWRVALSRVAQVAFHMFFRIKTKDATSGFRICKKEIFEQISLREKTFAIQLELTIKAEKAGFKLIEVPFVLVNREFGSSKFNFRQFKTYIKSIFRLMLNK
ncbi:glycosyltransferase [Methanoplanus sp. FWC-SCC4]|uniref:Glycosyltransferase n=1 Tax=Methanochimaera problematica TaxID=2609417 RepID=A0AA97I4N6_9EURY|nr:glycosyltransferase [Methanoplanus sp. FWC-SCC4]WOF17126.1 glycosyltransferase [Methanoplanus sp. FWC-SCC4]